MLEDQQLEVMGVRLICNPAVKNQEETYQLDALKVISGLRHEGVKKMSDGDRLLLDYELKVKVDPEANYVKLVQNAFANCEVQECKPDD